jgi:peptide/nickel transport system substrate-binding protein
MRNMNIVKGVFIATLIFSLIGCTTPKTETGKSEPAKETKETKETKVQRGELKVAYAAQPASLDPHMSFVVATTDIIWHVFETLLVLDSDGNIQPMLAESYEQSADGKTVTFKLRKGVMFHNGREMAADDVVASMNRWKTASVNGKNYFSKATSEAKDKYTVVLTLPEPLSIALITLANVSSGFPAIMPKEIAEGAGAKGINEYVGTGPFKFNEWKQDQYISLSRFEGYQSRQEKANGLAGKKEALLEKITFVFTPDPQTLLSGLQSAEFDVGQNVLYDNAKQVESDSNIKIFSYTAAQLPISFNKKKGLFSNVKARQAVAAALDMDAILKGAFSNEAYYKKNGTLMLYNQLGTWNSGSGKENYNVKNLEKAKQLLNEAGYHGEEVTIIVDRAYQEHYTAAVIVQEQLKKLGMNVKLNVFDWSSLLDRTRDENAYDIYLYGFLPTVSPLTLPYLNKEYPGWTNSPQLEGLLEKMKNQPSLVKTRDLYDDLQKWYWEYVPVVKVGDYDALVGVRNTVKGYGEQNNHTRPMYWNVSNNK